MGSDGKWYSGDMPTHRGVKPTGEKRPYWVAQSAREGTTHGKRFNTREELVADMESGLARRRAEFKTQLDKMDAAELQSQADYWLPKPQATTPTTPAPAQKPAKQKQRRQSKSMVSADKISDFQTGRDRVERRGDGTYVVDTTGQYAPVRVQSDVMTPEAADRIRNLPADKRAMARETTARTPYLSPEGRAERLAVFDEAKPTPPLPAATPKAAGEPGAKMEGMGGAVPEEFEKSFRTSTGIKKSAIAEVREERGIEPPEITAGKTKQEDTRQRVMEWLDEDPAWPDRLVAELDKKPRPITADEVIVLDTRYVDLQDQYRRALDEEALAVEDGRAESAIEAKRKIEYWGDKLNDFEQMVRQTGTHWGRTGAMMQRMMQADYSFEAMKRKARSARDFERLTPEDESVENTRLKDLADAWKKKHDDLLANQEKATKAAVDDAVANARKNFEKERKSPEVEAEKPARKKRIKPQGPTPEENIKKLSDALSESSNEGFKEGELEGYIKALVKEITRDEVARGRDADFDVVFDRAHKIIEQNIGPFERNDVLQAYSDYGISKPAPTEKAAIRIAQLRGEAQKILGLETVLKEKTPPKATGPRRVKVSDLIRRKIAEIHEAMKRLGVVASDPATQLASALQSRKTWRLNRIKDLRYEMATGKRILKTKSAPLSDAELQGIEKEYRELKAEHEKIFPKDNQITPEQRLKMELASTERQIAEWERRIANKEFDKAPKPSFWTIVPDALKSARDTRDALREQFKELKELAEGPARDAARRQNEIETLQERIAEVERRISERDFEAQKTSQNQTRPAHPEVEMWRQELERLNGNLDTLKREQNLVDSRAREVKRIEQKVAEIRNRITTGKLEGAPQSPKQNRPSYPELEAALQELEKAKTDLGTARSQQNEVSRRTKEVEKVNAEVNAIQSRIASGELAPQKKAAWQRRPLYPELEQARQRLEQARNELADARKNSEAMQLQSLKSRALNKIAELQGRRARGEFEKPPRRPDPKLDAEATHLKIQLEKVQDDFNGWVEKEKFKRLNWVRKTAKIGGAAWDAMRNIMTTGELSFVLRQGKAYVLAHPIKGTRAVIKTLKALASEDSARISEERIRNAPEYPDSQKAGLHIAKEGDTLSRQEELVAGRWGRAIPIVKNFNRAATTFLNEARWDTWMSLRNTLPRFGRPTLVEDAMYARMANESSGRGGLGWAEPAAVVLGRVAFAPRYLVSRMQLALFHSMWGGTARSRSVIATEYARIAAGYFIYVNLLRIGLNSLLPDDDKKKVKLIYDPRSSDFGKLRIGNSRLDTMSGLAQFATFAGRTWTGETLTGKGKVQAIVGESVPYGGQSWGDYAFRFGLSKSHPGIGSAAAMIPGAAKRMPWVPERIRKKFQSVDLLGNETSLSDEAGKYFKPITYVDIYKALREQGFDEGMTLSILAFLGEGLQTYNPNKK
jgi:hypothetical protein